MYMTICYLSKRLIIKPGLLLRFHPLIKGIATPQDSQMGRPSSLQEWDQCHTIWRVGSQVPLARGQWEEAADDTK